MKKRILFIDDEPKVLQGLQRALRSQTDAWDMVYVADVAKAGELLNQDRYDAVVLDVKMPGKNGLEVLSEIKANSYTRDIEVIMLTGLQDQGLKRRAIDLGATDLLNKPVLKEDLVARLNSVLAMKAYRDELYARNEELEQQLLQSQRMELIGILASEVVYYLNGIISTIVMDSEFIAQFLTDDTEVQKNLHQIKDSGQHARKILKQINRFSGKVQVKRELFGLALVVDGCLELLRFHISGGIVVEWDEPVTECLVRADKTQMYQMVMNFCVNAVHAMEKGGVLTISLTEVELDPNSVPPADRKRVYPTPYVRLSVTDTGCGIDPDMLECIFEPLFTIQETQANPRLGLSVAQRIVEDHGGIITVESTPGQGTTFFVYLPVA
ncbi:MAG: response regulator [Chloroflexi bacterium]|nr:response regulator [Chloroflexota bacterium]